MIPSRLSARARRNSAEHDARGQALDVPAIFGALRHLVTLLAGERATECAAAQVRSVSTNADCAARLVAANVGRRRGFVAAAVASRAARLRRLHDPIDVERRIDEMPGFVDHLAVTHLATCGLRMRQWRRQPVTAATRCRARARFGPNCGRLVTVAGRSGASARDRIVVWIRGVFAGQHSEHDFCRPRAIGVPVFVAAFGNHVALAACDAAVRWACVEMKRVCADSGIGRSRGPREVTRWSRALQIITGP